MIIQPSPDLGETSAADSTKTSGKTRTLATDAAIASACRWCKTDTRLKDE